MEVGVGAFLLLYCIMVKTLKQRRQQQRRQRKMGGDSRNSKDSFEEIVFHVNSHHTKKKFNKTQYNKDYNKTYNRKLKLLKQTYNDLYHDSHACEAGIKKKNHKRCRKKWIHDILALQLLT